MRLVFEKDGTYTTNAMNMSTDEKNIVRAKLKDMGVVLRKTDEAIPAPKGIEILSPEKEDRIIEDMFNN